MALESIYPGLILTLSRPIPAFLDTLLQSRVAPAPYPLSDCQGWKERFSREQYNALSWTRKFTRRHEVGWIGWNGGTNRTVNHRGSLCWQVFQRFVVASGDHLFLSVDAGSKLTEPVPGFVPFARLESSLNFRPQVRGGGHPLATAILITP